MEVRCPHCGQRNRVPAKRLASAVSCGKCHQPLLNRPVDAEPAMLAELIADSAIPVLVDFWAPWCGPCLQFAPTFTAAAGKQNGAVLFAKLDTEAHQDVAQKHGIRSIPTLAAFVGGKEVLRRSGALPAAELDKLVRQLIGQV